MPSLRHTWPCTRSLYTPRARAYASSFVSQKRERERGAYRDVKSLNGIYTRTRVFRTTHTCFAAGGATAACIIIIRNRRDAIRNGMLCAREGVYASEVCYVMIAVWFRLRVRVAVVLGRLKVLQDKTMGWWIWLFGNYAFYLYYRAFLLK